MNRALLESTAVSTAKRKFHPYAIYRRSEVWGIPAIPDHWQEKPLKCVVAINTDKLPETTDPDYEIEYVDIGNVNLEAGITSTERYRFENAPSRARRRVRHGDTIVSTVQTYLKAVAQIVNPPDNLIVSTGFAVLRAKPPLDPGFLYWLAQSEPLVERIMAHSVGASYPAINASEIGRFTIPLPPLDEQRAIAALLDRETARIDELIAKKQRLVELLKEKRQAVISRAVTGQIDVRNAPPAPAGGDRGRDRRTGKGHRADAPGGGGMTASALQEIDVALPLRKWQRYSDYKPIGLPWLPKAPTHWSAKRLRYVVRFPTKGEVRGLPLDTLVSFVPMEAIGEYGGLSLDQTRPIEEVLNGYTYFRNGDVLVAKITPCFENGKGALAEGLENGLGFGTTGLHVLRPGAEILPKYLFYLTLGEHFRKLGTAEMYGAGGQKRVPEQFIQNLKHPLPPLDEQRAIAAFLDRETARIDGLIAKKQRLVELLKEKRQAVISRAVTKGLNPNAPMKPSGIVWLGEIPTHWEMNRIGFLTTSQGGCTPSKDNVAFWNGDFPWVTPKDMKLDVISDSADHVTEEALQNTGLKLIPNPAVLIVVRGMILAHTFPVALTQAPVSINQDMKALKPVKTLDAEFLSCLLRACSPAFFAIVEESGHGTRVLRTDLWSKQELPIPPIEEQRNIADFVRQTTKQHDDLANKVGRAISLLNAYRSALITAAVTGQIDVRNYHAEAIS